MVQSMAVPNCAPTCEYVAMPLGSSSAAPVIKPGPKRNTKARVFLERFESGDVFSFVAGRVTRLCLLLAWCKGYAPRQGYGYLSPLPGNLYRPGSFVFPSMGANGNAKASPGHAARARTYRRWLLPEKDFS